MLGGIRAEGSAVDHVSLEPPWALRFADGAPLTILTLVTGAGTLVPADGTEWNMRAGTTALVRGPEPFDLADGPGAPERPRRTFHVSCLGPRPSCEPRLDDDAATTVVVGAYQGMRARHLRLLRTLPPALVLHEEVDDVLWLHSLRDALTRVHRPGGQAMIDRVLDWGLVCTLGCWFELRGGQAPGWYRGVLDPVTGPALEAFHRDPAEAWTVGSLAARARVSRAQFARRFTEVMGEPPLSYLTEWRMSLAEDLLDDPDLSVAQVAKAVGYTDPFAFSTAFKRRRGLSPREFRARR
ncbi:AraC family transcriptional regulator [Glycomyces tarimensis]